MDQDNELVEAFEKAGEDVDLKIRELESDIDMHGEAVDQLHKRIERLQALRGQVEAPKPKRKTHVCRACGKTYTGKQCECRKAAPAEPAE